MEQLGAGSRAEYVEALTERLLDLGQRRHLRTLRDPPMACSVTIGTPLPRQRDQGTKAGGLGN